MDPPPEPSWHHSGRSLRRRGAADGAEGGAGFRHRSARPPRPGLAPLALCLLGLFLLIGRAAAHSRILSFAGAPPRYPKDVCQAGNCWAPCGALKEDGRPARLQLRRGQTVRVTWPRNNHPGGFIRWAVAPYNRSDFQSSFDVGVVGYSCFEVNCRGAYYPEDPRSGDPPGTVENGNVCRGTFTIPRYLPNGRYTVQWMWFGGGAVRGNIYEGQTDWISCVDFTVIGSMSSYVSKRANQCPTFRGGDAWTTLNGPAGQCQYFGNGKRQNQCYPYRCPGGYQTGIPDAVAECRRRGRPVRSLMYTNNTDSNMGNPYGPVAERREIQAACWATYDSAFRAQELCWPQADMGQTTLAQCNALLAEMNAQKERCTDLDSRLWAQYPPPAYTEQNYPIPEPNLIRPGGGSTTDNTDQNLTPLVDQSGLRESTDNRCGPSVGARCPAGRCCSAMGYCSSGGSPNDDSNSAWCSIPGGCQIGYGDCQFTDVCPAYGVSGNGRCGPDNGGMRCPQGQCCGNDGQCGTSTTACGNGCMRGYGRCLGTGAFVCGGALASRPSGGAVTAPCPRIKFTTTGRCGPNHGYRRCQDGLCCSASGFCQDDGGSNGQAWCDAQSCLRGFGKCWGDATFTCPNI